MKTRFILLIVLFAVQQTESAPFGSQQSNGIIRNRSNTQIGRIDADGVVRNSSNTQIGKIEADGVLRNSSNAQIGSAKGIRREWAAVVFFFFDFDF